MKQVDIRINASRCEEAGLEAYAKVFVRNGWSCQATVTAGTGDRKMFLLRQRFAIAKEEFQSIAASICRSCEDPDEVDFQSIAESLFEKAGECVGVQVHSQECN